ncbi:MAG: ATP-binding protein, partial [Planctomycetes bacterium]|nr:ATP-binding protein [Planctomycetota bacterium]
MDYEALGAFYLGKRVDPRTGELTAEPILYDSRDLTTHAMCVGMTGSGKTGLCLALIEEAAIDGIPVLAIDPKGDLGNLMLTFPELRAGDFEPWIDREEAARKGRTPEQHAESISRTWRDGLAQWQQDGERIRRLRAAADFAIYTPGSDAGLGLSILRGFDAPPPAVRADREAMTAKVQSAVSSLLALLSLDTDPLQSREHIYLSNVLTHHWQAGTDLSIAELIRSLQEPPFTRIGVMDVDTVFPARDRFGLAMALNGLLASPAFAAWSEGEPLDVQRLLHTDSGQPRVSIVSIAHLPEDQRMFFVTLLLSEVLAWTRQQPGTSSLRALIYMDEVFGYLPPTQNPPSKLPLMTLLKQARAYGVGVMLATQNPVDLDYKALSNMGTWFLGRLQTERDKLRVLDGLEGASAQTGAVFDRAAVERALSGMESRRFLLHDVHEDG